MKIRMTMTEEQARLVSRACELYARLQIGQFEELSWELIHADIKDFQLRRDVTEELLNTAKMVVFPDLRPYRNSSYSIYENEKAEKTFGVYQAIRIPLGDNREPYNHYPLPDVEVIEEEEA